MSNLAKRLIERFHSKEYAHSYMQSHVASRIAAQIFANRKERDLTQKQLSEISGISQEKISTLESADFESLTLKTIYKLASAFDVGVSVEFIPFSKSIMDVVNLKPQNMVIESREPDLAGFSDKNFFQMRTEWICEDLLDTDAYDNVFSLNERKIKDFNYQLDQVIDLNSGQEFAKCSI